MATAKKLPSGSWRVQVYGGKDANGHKIMRSFTAPTKREAERDAAVWAMERKRKTVSLTLGDAMRSYIDTCRAQGYSPATIISYESKMKRYSSITPYRLDRLNAREVQAALDKRSAEVRPSTLKSDYAFIHTVIKKYAPEIDLYGITLAKRSSRKKAVLQESIARTILQEAIKKDADLFIYCLFTICAGLRPSESYALTWADISPNPVQISRADGSTFNAGMISIDKSTVKGDKGEYITKGTKSDAGTRSLCIDWSVFDSLYSIRQRGSDDERIIKLKPAAMSMRWSRFRKTLDIPEGFRFYDLRHYYATSVAYSGASEEELARAMGHSNSAFSHNVYVEMFSENAAVLNDRMASKTADLMYSIKGSK